MQWFWNKTVPYDWEKKNTPKRFSSIVCKWNGCNVHKVKSPHWWSKPSTWNRKVCIRCLKVIETSDK